MRKFLPVLLVACLFMGVKTEAQRNCGTMEVLQNQLNQFPEMDQKMRDIEQFTQKYISNTPGSKAVITIPVVVHVVYKRNNENISNAQIQSQIAVLNEDFRRNNNDQTNFWSQAADVEIEFCLATVDPNGNSTDGIQRRQTNKRSFQTNDAMKYNSQGGIDAWPSSDYMNVWSCNISGGILGYAQFPGGNASTDGVVIDYAYFGRGGTAQAPFDLGRTATHEVGHWLNLRHIWGDGGCNVDDFVNDTPESDAPNYGCATGHFSCSNRDMVENYMDYSDDDCMNLFTTDQGSRMNALFAPGGARASIASSGGCGNSGPSCFDGILNQNETDVDCGGVCQACPTCNDGIQNQGEQGVDCGGPCTNSCQGGSCEAPSGLSHTRRKGGREGLLEWNSVSAASNYEVQLDSNPSFSAPSGGTTTNTSIIATGLTKNNVYHWRVRSICGGSNSDWAVSSFTARLNSSNTLISIYPNPSSYFVTLDFSEISTDIKSAIIYNSTGTVVNDLNLQSFNGEIKLDVTNYQNGIYILNAVDVEGEIHNQKFMVIK